MVEDISCLFFNFEQTTLRGMLLVFVHCTVLFVVIMAFIVK